MKRSVILIGILCVAVFAFSQSQFLRLYDFGTVEDSYQVRYYKKRIFINTATFCGTECSFLSEIDTVGNILWRTEVPDLDIASGTMVIVNDTITVTGNNDPFNTAFRMAHFTLDGEKIGETIEIAHPTRKFTRMFQLTTQYFNGKYVICGPGWEGDTAWSMIYVVNKSGELDTLITVEPTNAESDLWDSYIDNQGRLTTIHQVEWAFSPINYRRIFKFDLNYDTVWSYKTDNDQFDDVIPYGCGLNDGRSILSVEHPVGVSNPHSIRAIKPDKTISWQYNYASTGSTGRYILRLKTLANGDIMGSGLYSELAQKPRISDSPWLFRLSTEGDLLWERTYYEYDSTIESSRLGAIFDFVELDNGDIMAVGYLRYNNNDMLIMRVDSNGCLDPDNCHTVNIITGTHDLPQRTDQRILLYPNPVRDILQIKFRSNTYHLEIEVLDITGRIVTDGILTEGFGEVDTSRLPGGLYWVSVEQEGRVLALEKFVKIEK